MDHGTATLRKLILPLSAIALLGLIVACSDDPTEPATLGKVEGRVTVYGTDVPVTDAVLLLVDAGTLAPARPPTPTDSKGSYDFAGVPAGTYAVFVYHDSLVTWDRTASLVEVKVGKTSRHDMRVTPSQLWNGSGDRVEGMVTDAISGEPIAGAYVDGILGMSDEVYGLMAGISLPEWGVTDDRGFYSVTTQVMTDETGWPIGPGLLTCIKEGYFPQTVTYLQPDARLARAEGDTLLTIDVALVPITDADAGALGSLTGRLLNRGEPVAGLGVALVLISIEDPGLTDKAREKVIVPGSTVTTDAEGRFAIDNLAPGFYMLAPGFHIDDGYANINWNYVEEIFEVVAEATTELGDLEILRTIGGVSPANGETGVATTPLLTWEAVPGAEEYEVQWRVNGYLMMHRETGLTETRFQIPGDAAVPHGSCVRWMVRASAWDPDLGYNVTLARTDWSLTFCVVEE